MYFVFLCFYKNEINITNNNNKKKILKKYYQLSILGKLDLPDHIHQKR